MIAQDKEIERSAMNLEKYLNINSAKVETTAIWKRESQTVTCSQHAYFFASASHTSFNSSFLHNVHL